MHEAAGVNSRRPADKIGCIAGASGCREGAAGGRQATVRRGRDRPVRRAERAEAPPPAWTRATETITFLLYRDLRKWSPLGCGRSDELAGKRPWKEQGAEGEWKGPPLPTRPLVYPLGGTREPGGKGRIPRGHSAPCSNPSTARSRPISEPSVDGYCTPLPA